MLYSAKRGWLAIDPKGLIGERTYDYANLFCNPNYAWASQTNRMAHQIEVVTQHTDIEPSRLLQWIVAYTGLSAAWYLESKNQQEATAVLELNRVAFDVLKL